MEPKHIHKSHNVTLLLYHIVLVAKYRRMVFSDAVDKTVKDICLEIEKRYEIKFLEIWSDKNHIHLVVQSVPTYSPKQIVQTIKSIVARQVFKINPEVKRQLRGGEFWTDWYYVNTVWWYTTVDAVIKYVQHQWGKDYQSIHRKLPVPQSLFDV